MRVPRKHILYICSVGLGVGLSTTLVVHANPWWSVIGWHPDHKNYCGGYYSSTAQLAGNAIPLPGTKDTTITSTGVANLVKSGDSILHGNVVLKQPGRVVLADKAIISRDDKTSKVNLIRLYGNVFIFTADREATAPYAVLHPKTNTLQANKVIYRIAMPGSPFNAWGRGDSFHGKSKGVWHMSPASYTTCSPTSPSWVFNAKHLIINEKKKRGYGHHVWMRYHDIPFFYLPYISFSLEDKRKTGFLAPSYTHSNHGGAGIDVPFYWNMAPNYDAMFNTSYYTKRHLKEDILLRHLNSWGSGNEEFFFLPNDGAFTKFTQEEIADFNTPQYAPYIQQLKNSNSFRWGLGINENAAIGDKITGDLQLNRVSDPYVPQSFDTVGMFSANQLFNKASVSYNGNNLQADVLAQGFQTLHAINALQAYDQYARLPEFDVGMEKNYGGLSASLASQWVDFAFDDFNGSNQGNFVGSRAHFRPALSFNEVKSWGYITPEVQDDIAVYSAQTLNRAQQADNSRSIPMFSVDSGLYLEQKFKLFRHKFRQYITPRLFYLYVPYQNQNAFPNFASTLLPFSYDQLFMDNAYTDFDRIQNANQISAGLQTALYNDSGVDKLDIGTGIADYFTRPAVTLSPASAPLQTEKLSPWATTVAYNINSHLSTSLDYNYDVVKSRTVNVSSIVSYTNNSNGGISLGYSYIPDYNQNINYNYITTGVFLGLTTHWSGFGYVYYDVHNRYATQDFTGLQYDNCCWALRLLYNTTSLGADAVTNANRYDHQYLFQIVFKGLTSYGSGSAIDTALALVPGSHNNVGEMI